ncbi:unnamed protein product [Cuscuta europaea]|uniref:ATP-dependent RNA helicase n=1 Tax=Cuscuta europaea TaxID=41803 RepID=A0A9P0YU71_CUSEU|nr:unnamed protein product [Cuscuta europaea]
MGKAKIISQKEKIQRRESEINEIKLLEEWIESRKPECGVNPLAIEPLPDKAPLGRLADGSFSQYAGCTRFRQLPLSKKTQDGLAGAKYKTMTDIQRASLPHALCGRDILGAAKTGSGKTLAFIIPILEKLYKARWSPEDGVGCIIISPTRELADQLFEVLTSVGKHHSFSAGILIGGRKDIEIEKERVHGMNILICTPGRLLQHMDETPNFDCSQLQVRFVYEAFKKLRPGIPLKCLHGRMKLAKRMGIYSMFREETRSVLFSTDVASRGLDFSKAIDWVLQVDCPEDCATYIHRVGRTARYLSGGKSLLFVMPSEIKMLEKLEEKKIPLHVSKAKAEFLQSVSGLLAALLVQCPELQPLARRAFTTYLKSIYRQTDKEVFDVTKLPVEEFSASLGLPMTPKIRFLKQKVKGKTVSEALSVMPEDITNENLLEFPIKKPDAEESEDDILIPKDTHTALEAKTVGAVDSWPVSRIPKKNKLKISADRPFGTRVIFDDGCNTLPPLAKLAQTMLAADKVRLDHNKVNERYGILRNELKLIDREDKGLDRQRRKEKRLKEKMKLKRGRDQEWDEEEEGDLLGSDANAGRGKAERKKIRFGSDDDGDFGENDGTFKTGMKVSPVSVAEQEELALKLLSSMHS